MLDHPFTRYPVFEEDLDDIVGILHVRDLFSALHDRGMDRVDLRSILRTAIVVPETKHLDELLTEFQTTSNHMAIVVDEYGSVEGLVTLEDLLEEIVGEIGDEFDRPEAGVLRIGRGRVRIGGSFPIDEFNERFGTNLPDDDYHTVGGFVFGELGRAPKVGDSVGFDGARFEVVLHRRAADHRGRRHALGGRGARPVRTRARARASRESSSLCRAIFTSDGVIPPALWLTQRRVTVSHEMDTSGWWSAAFAASAIRFRNAIEPLKSPQLNDFSSAPSRTSQPSSLPTSASSSALSSTRHRQPPASSGHKPSYGARIPVKGLNDTDLAIIALLQAEGRATFAQIAQQVGLSPAAVHERVKKLEARGVITGYKAVVDPEKLGAGVTAFVLVTQSARPRGGLEDAFERWPWVEECHHIAGEESLLLKVRAESTRALEHVLWEIRALDSVERTKTVIALTTEFEGRPVTPIPVVEDDVAQSGAA